MRPFRIHLVFMDILMVINAACAPSDLDVKIDYTDEADARKKVKCHDSLTVAFESGFKDDSVRLWMGDQVIVEKVLDEDLSLGLSDIARIPKVAGMELALEIGGKRTVEIDWEPDYCQLRLSYDRRGEGVVNATFSNRVMVYFWTHF